MEWAPAKEASPVLVAEENPPEEYGPWQWAAAFGRATGLLASRGLHRCRENGRLCCPTGASLNFGRSASRECLHESVLSTWPTRLIGSRVLCGSSAWHRE